jgi:asparagine synthase (glutamine-hydrolysing)
MNGVGAPRVVHQGCVALLHRALRATEGGIAQPRDQGDLGTVVADCRLDEPGEIANALGVIQSRRRDDSQLVAEACGRWRDGAAARLNGSFAFAHWDAATGRLILARDAFGTRPLFYVAHPHYLFFASTLGALLALPEVSRELDELMLAQYLTIEPKDNQRTIYRHIHRVPPGGMIIADHKGVRTELYWTIDDIVPVRLKRDDDYVEAARALLDRAVACRLPDNGHLGITLSGGLDSGGIAATAARLLGDTRFDAFHRAPGGPHPYAAMDERALVAAIATQYPSIDLTIIDRNRPSPGDVEPEIDAAMMAVPRGRSVNVAWFEPLLDAAASRGVDVLMMGGCGNATLSWNGAPHFAADLRAGRWGTAWRGMALAASQRERSVPRFAAAHLLKPLVPRAMLRARSRRAAGNRSPWALYSMVSDDFLASLDYAARSRETGHDLPFQRMDDPRARRLMSLQAQSNRDKNAAVRHTVRFETRDPYVDRRLVEFTLGIPNEQFWHQGQDRWLARRVLADRLPPQLVMDRRRGLQCPEWFDIVSGNRDGMAAAIERIERSPLASRIVDVARMKALLDDWPRDAEAAKRDKQIYAHALSRGISIGGFLRWYEGGNG